MASATVDRVLPWRRSGVPTDEIAPVLSAYRARHPKASTTMIAKAYDMAAEAHSGQMRNSGEGYIHHPLAVARIVAELGLDDITIAAALLHDAVEDTGVTLDDVRKALHADVALIVDGVTKLERIHFDSKEAQHAATMRKLLVAIAKDLRVLIIKLADRLHNMRTIGGMAPAKQRRIAQETMEIYAPLAHRLGMQEIKCQLEDLAFASLHPRRYAEISQMVTTRLPERERIIDDVTTKVKARLVELQISADVSGRPKHLWSIYEKMVIKGREFGDIFDLVAIRVIVDSVKDCYGALGSIHALWRPVQGRFKDYIAMPKFNLYQSLHTTVVGPNGKPIEVQIRTKEMHSRAEHGVASHWAYKASGSGANDDMVWLNRIIDWQAETQDPAEFMAALKTDLEQDEVFVFTPNGSVITLPLGATPVDFAYAIHTEIGHTCIGARVTGRLMPLDTKLTSGDSVEIFTSKVGGAGPSMEWLDSAVTPKARNKIKQWFSREKREDTRDTGHEDLMAALRAQGLPPNELDDSDTLKIVAKQMHYDDLETLYIAIGEGHVGAEVVAHRVGNYLHEAAAEEQISSGVQSHKRGRRGENVGIHVEGLEDVMIRLSRCCTPVPGDEIIGFVTRGRGLSVHRTDCANATSLAGGAGDRVVEVEWDRDSHGTFVASIEVKALDRSHLLRDVANSLSDHHVNIVGCSTFTGNDRIAVMRFDFELGDPSHLASVISLVKRIDAVYDAYRVLPGKATVHGHS